jgi:hypothetical protein
VITASPLKQINAFGERTVLGDSQVIDDGGKSGVQDAPGSVARLVSTRWRWLPSTLALAMIGYWLVVKSVLFHRLEYTSDLITDLQLTRSFFEGRPLLWDNIYGDHKAFHNLYIAVLFYPLTRFLGAYGLFLAQALLYGWAVYKILGCARDAVAWKRGLYWATVAAIALGPVGFWIFEDPVYGFHYELLFVPLGVLFALSLSKRSKSAWIFAGLIVLTREEGAVVGWCIHVLYEVLNAEDTGDVNARIALLRRLGWITLAWVLVFLAGMGLLFAMAGSHGRHGSTISALPRLIADPEARSSMLASLTDAVLLFAAGAVVYLAGIPPRGLKASALISLVLVAPTAVASSFYGKDIGYHGFAWAPRFALFWAVALAGCLFAIGRARAPAFAAWRRRRWAVAITVAVSIVAQVGILGVRKHYDFLSRFTLQAFFAPASLAALIVQKSTLQEYLSRPRYVSAGLSAPEDTFLSCLGHDLPRETAVSATGGLFGRFHQQDLIKPDRVDIAGKQPALVVCDDSGRIPWEYGCQRLSRALPASSYDTLQLGNLFVRYANGPKAVVEACAARALPTAGSAGKH